MKKRTQWNVKLSLIEDGIEQFHMGLMFFRNRKEAKRVYFKIEREMEKVFDKFVKEDEIKQSNECKG